ncbi:unnamed protein product [Amoebophrya sp. A120]|nr:unnamed protein product [Amoebophrya sp. A120]|eukprot:GSA120T00003965001.1
MFFASNKKYPAAQPSKNYTTMLLLPFLLVACVGVFEFGSIVTAVRLTSGAASRSAQQQGDTVDKDTYVACLFRAGQVQVECHRSATSLDAMVRNAIVEKEAGRPRTSSPAGAAARKRSGSRGRKGRPQNKGRRGKSPASGGRQEQHRQPPVREVDSVRTKTELMMKSCDRLPDAVFDKKDAEMMLFFSKRANSTMKQVAADKFNLTARPSSRSAYHGFAVLWRALEREPEYHIVKAASRCLAARQAFEKNSCAAVLYPNDQNPLHAFADEQWRDPALWKKVTHAKEVIARVEDQFRGVVQESRIKELAERGSSEAVDSSSTAATSSAGFDTDDEDATADEIRQAAKQLETEKRQLKVQQAAASTWQRQRQEELAMDEVERLLIAQVEETRLRQKEEKVTFYEQNEEAQKKRAETEVLRALAKERAQVSDQARALGLGAQKELTKGRKHRKQVLKSLPMQTMLQEPGRGHGAVEQMVKADRDGNAELLKIYYQRLCGTKSPTRPEATPEDPRPPKPICDPVLRKEHMQKRLATLGCAQFFKDKEAAFLNFTTPDLEQLLVTQEDRQAAAAAQTRQNADVESKALCFLYAYRGFRAAYRASAKWLWLRVQVDKENREKGDAKFATDPKLQHLKAANFVSRSETDPAQQLAEDILEEWKRKVVRLDVNFQEWMNANAGLFMSDTFTLREEALEGREEGSPQMKQFVENVAQALKRESEGRATLYQSWNIHLAHEEQGPDKDLRAHLAAKVENKLGALPRVLEDRARFFATQHAVHLDPRARNKEKAKEDFLCDTASIVVAKSLAMATPGGEEDRAMAGWKEQAKHPANANEKKRYNAPDFYLHNFQLHGTIAQSVLGGTSLSSLGVHFAIRREAATYEARLEGEAAAYDATRQRLLDSLQAELAQPGSEMQEQFAFPFAELLGLRPFGRAGP